MLICDDNEAMRMLLGVIVGGSPKLEVVGEASNGNDAIAQATRLQPNVMLYEPTGTRASRTRSPSSR